MHVLRARSRPLLIAYARLAVWLFAVVVVTGLVSALLLVPFSDLATTSYGQVLLAKLVLVAAASALAVAARRHLQRHQTPRRPAGIEAAVLAGVLALSAVLTVLPAPAQTDPSLPFAPAADGPVVPAGTRAGEIGISARASAGQLVIDLTAPATGERANERYELAGTFADPRGRSSSLKLRGCGTGCFYAHVPWRDGSSRVTLAA
ncbi:CopD family protein [Actinacidiphila glaucinigra]